MTRRLALLLIPVPALAGALLLQGPARATPVTALPPTATTVPAAPLRLVGTPSPVLDQAIAYWNKLADHPLLEYSGAYDGGIQDARTVTVNVADLEPGLAGLTQGNVGSTPLVVTIDTLWAGDWVAYAHELGHTLGIGHQDEPGYRGVMQPLLPPAGTVRARADRQFFT